MRKIATLAALTICCSGLLSLAGPRPMEGADEMKGKLRILVLPFATPRNTPELEKYSTGTMDTLIMALKHVPSFIMIDRSQVEDEIKRQALQMSGVANDKTSGGKIGGIMGAQVLMAGSMQKAGQTVRITANIVDISTSEINESEKVTGEIQKLFDLQLQLAQLFAKDVKIEITPEQNKSIEAVVKSTTDLGAYEFYTQGRTAYLRFSVAGFQQAVDLFQKALGVDPKYALAYAGLGQAYASWGVQAEKAGDDPRPYYDKALEHALKAKELAPNIAEPYLALAFAYNALGQWDQLQETVDKLLQLDPNSAEGYLMKATLYKENDPQRVQVLRQAIKLNPNLSAAHTNLARALEAQGSTADAIREYEWALSFGVDSVAYTNLGQIYYKMGQMDKAVAAWEAALKADPRHTIALLKLGIAMEKQGQLDKAIDYYERASQIATAMTPQRMAILIQLGDAYRKAKQLDKATATYQAILQADAKAEDALIGLGIVDWEQGRQEQAVGRWHEVLQINPDNARAKKLLLQAGGK